MAQMFLLDGGGAAGGVALHGRVHEAVLVPQVRAAKLQQLLHAGAGLRQLQIVLRIDAAQAHECVGHVRAQGLVDEGVHVHARCGFGLRQGGDFLLVHLHHCFLGVGAGTP